LPSPAASVIYPLDDHKQSKRADIPREHYWSGQSAARGCLSSGVFP
jgi:hypothetical protein